MKHLLPRVVAIAAGGILLMSAYHRTNSASMVTDAANHFLNSLTPEQKAKAVFEFKDDERMNWHFIPKERKGLAIREMEPYQKHLADVLLIAGLSQQGAMKAHTIMSLEDVLKTMENDNGEKRNPEKYYFSVFGTPSDAGVWGYRIEGHHVSQNYTVSNGIVIDGPSFFGANPAEVRQGPRAGLRVLAAEEDMGRDLLTSLDDGQKKIAIVDPVGYKEILTEASRKAALNGQPSGISASKMSSAQYQKLVDLLDLYAHNLPDQMAQARMDKVKQAGKSIFFAWAGGPAKGDPHYYRVQTSTFLVEYDDTQNGANHIHTVWRDFNGDFGLDMLQQHYQSSHAN